MLHFICTYTDDPTKTESNDDTCSLTESYCMFCPNVGLAPCEHHPEECLWRLSECREREELVPTSAFCVFATFKLKVKVSLSLNSFQLICRAEVEERTAVKP